MKRSDWVFYGNGGRRGIGGIRRGKGILFSFEKSVEI